MYNIDKVLLFDNDKINNIALEEALKEAGFEVLTATKYTDAKQVITSMQPDAVIIDVIVKIERDEILTPEEAILSKKGERTGMLLAQWIIDNHPKLRFLAYSGSSDNEVIAWFKSSCDGFFTKGIDNSNLLVKFICKYWGKPRKKNPKCFIVHGHDDNLRRELINYLTGRLFFPMPIILKDESEDGRIIIEKLEELSENVDAVFVLLTPDDICISVEEKNKKLRRARQNVILELGYFLGKFGRKSGKIIILKKGEVELPSDLNGLLFIDISDTVEAAGEKFRAQSVIAKFLAK